MIAWYLVIALCLVDGLLCHELMKAWDELSKRRKGGRNRTQHFTFWWKNGQTQTREEAETTDE